MFGAYSLSAKFASLIRGGVRSQGITWDFDYFFRP
jgi:hypothetical protein